MSKPAMSESLRRAVFEQVMREAEQTYELTELTLMRDVTTGQFTGYARAQQKESHQGRMFGHSPYVQVPVVVESIELSFPEVSADA